MNQVCIDTHGLIWYLSRPKRLGRAAARLLREADAGRAEILVPAIVLIELTLLREAGRNVVGVPQVEALLAAQRMPVAAAPRHTNPITHQLDTQTFALIPTLPCATWQPQSCDRYPRTSFGRRSWRLLRTMTRHVRSFRRAYSLRDVISAAHSTVPPLVRPHSPTLPEPPSEIGEHLGKVEHLAGLYLIQRRSQRTVQGRSVLAVHEITAVGQDVFDRNQIDGRALG